MAPKDIMTTDESQIRALIDDWADALRAKDIDRVMSHYAPDVLAFDAIAQLQFKGRDAYRQHWQACLSMCQDPSIFEIHELGIDVRRRSRLLACPQSVRRNGRGRSRKSLLDAHDGLLPQDRRRLEGRA